MANTVTNHYKFEGLAGKTIDWTGNAGIKIMLLDNNPLVYTISPDTNFVDESGANDVVDAEYVGSGYTGGFGGAGRVALASKTTTEDDANDRVELDAADVTYTAIGSGAETIDVVGVIDETGAANDLASDYIASIDSGLPVTTNGGDVTFQWNAEGILQLA